MTDLPLPEGKEIFYSFLPFKGRIKVGMGFYARSNEQNAFYRQPSTRIATQYDRCREKSLEYFTRQAD